MSTRNRIVRSSSLGGELSFFSPVKPSKPPAARSRDKNPAAAAAAPRAAAKPVENLKPSVAKPEQHRRSVLTFASPPRERKDEWSENDVDKRFGAFLQACYCCKKKISEKDVVYMYGYLRAFCSLDCRNIQICIDDNDREPSPKSTHTRAENFIRRGLARRGSTKVSVAGA